MQTRDENEQHEDARAAYEPPAIEEELEFETSALAACGKTASVGSCVVVHNTSAS
jgi:hypothetical protein